jgi:hypothetical protein
MYAPRIQTLNIKAFENELRQKKYIMIYAFHGCPIEIPAHIPRGRSKGNFDENSEKLLYMQRTYQNLPYRSNTRNIRTFSPKIKLIIFRRWRALITQ